ncbi:hypothetical protein LCGC14_1192430 [marine sediment metagenome]|uniref:Uncharacterized protein n=1 Tax=marine sediment metagenome TaxID=412755 RepID=A0A0F9PPA5_9ZZZZ
MNSLITLSWHEVILGAQLGIFRQIASLKDNLPDNYGYDGKDGWTKHIEGSCGELAFAKFYNCYWDATLNTFKKGQDVGGFQVRTRSSDNYDLIVRPDDRNEDKFVLLTGRIPKFYVRGWMLGKDAKQKKWKQEYGGRPAAYFVPASELHNLK